MTAQTAAEDAWVPPAWSASSTAATFAAGGFVITCTKDATAGPSIGSAPDVGALKMSAPKFSNCTDNVTGGSDTVTTAQKGWTISFVSDSALPACPSGWGDDDVTTDRRDCIVLGFPKDAATIAIGAAPGCTLTIQADGPAAVGATMSGYYADYPHSTDTFAFSNQPLSYTASGPCPVGSRNGTFGGTYAFHSPYKGKFADTTRQFDPGGVDAWYPPPWAAFSANTTIVAAGGFTVTCTSASAVGSDIGPAPDSGPFGVWNGNFTNCTDNATGGTDTVTIGTSEPQWTIMFVSDSGNPACPTGSGDDEAGGSDCVVFHLPQQWMTITVNDIPGCTLTVQPTAATAIGGTLNDPGGKTKDTFAFNNQPLSYSATSACPISSGNAGFTATYTLTNAPVANGAFGASPGVLVDNS